MARKLTIRQTHAALPTVESNTSASTYSALRGGASTADINEYRKTLASLSIEELQYMAVESGTVIPAADRDRLITRLIEEFIKANK